MAKSPLYDKEKPKGEEKPDPEKKPEAEAAATESSEEAPAGDADGAAAAADGEAEEAASPKDMFLDGLKAIHKRHEKERMDHHGSMREAHRTMGSRHNKEIADHFDLSFGAGGTAGKDKASAKAGDAKPAGKSEAAE